MHNFHLPVYRKESTLILSSFKVMYSFLQKQEELDRIYWNKKTLHLAIQNKFLNSPDALFLLRNPEARFLSYFKDKFRKEPRRMIEERRLAPQNLQCCQRLYLNYIGADTDNVEDCCNKLLEASMNSVVEWLPSSYKKDCHTIPQTSSLHARWQNFKLKLRVSNMFLIDREDDLERFSQMAGLNVAQKINHTSDVDENLEMSQPSSSILQNIYKSDWELISSIRR